MDVARGREARQRHSAERAYSATDVHEFVHLLERLIPSHDARRFRAFP